MRNGYDWERFLVGLLLAVLTLLAPIIVAGVLGDSVDPNIRRILDPNLIPDIQRSVESLNDLLIQMYTMNVALVGVLTQSLYFAFKQSQGRTAKLCFLGSIVVSFTLLFFMFAAGWARNEVSLAPYLLGNRSTFLGGLYFPPTDSPITWLRLIIAIWALLLGVAAGFWSERNHGESLREARTEAGQSLLQTSEDPCTEHTPEKE